MGNAGCLQRKQQQLGALAWTTAAACPSCGTLYKPIHNTAPAAVLSANDMMGLVCIVGTVPKEPTITLFMLT
jgi:hypothetical protein